MVVSQAQSPYGSGWGIRGVERLVPVDPDDDGDRRHINIDERGIDRRPAPRAEDYLAPRDDRHQDHHRDEQLGEGEAALCARAQAGTAQPVRCRSETHETAIGGDACRLERRRGGRPPT